MRVGFVGDICVNGLFLDNFQKDGKILSNDVKKLFHNCDYVVGNLEGATTNEQIPKLEKQVHLKNPKDFFSWANQYSLVYNLANNHILDYGEDAFLQTIQYCEANASPYFGHKIQPCIIHNKGVSVALFSCVDFLENPRLVNTCSKHFIKKLKEQIQKIRQQVDFIVLNYHGGEEFSHYPSPAKRKKLKQLAKIKGVDIIIGHHSHTVQGIEYEGNVPIFYSLGNFIFDLEHHRNYEWTDFSILLEFEFTKDSFKFRFVPVDLQRGFVSVAQNQEYDNHLTVISNFIDYRKKWRKEAHRILFRADNPKFNQIEDSNSMQNHSIWKLLLSQKFYQKVILILRNPLFFSIYWNALLYKYFKR